MHPDVSVFAYKRIQQLTPPLFTDIPDPSARQGTVKWIREEIERNRHVTDVVNNLVSYSSNLSADVPQDKIQTLIAAGRRELKQVLPMG